MHINCCHFDIILPICGSFVNRFVDSTARTFCFVRNPCKSSKINPFLILQVIDFHENPCNAYVKRQKQETDAFHFTSVTCNMKNVRQYVDHRYIIRIDPCVFVVLGLASIAHIYECLRLQEK